MLPSLHGSLFRALSGLFLAGSVACAHAGVCDPPPPFYVTVQASERLNPDSAGRPLPTLVRVLQLQSAARLLEADFTSIFQRAEDTLKEDLLRADDFNVDPAGTESRGFERSPKAPAVAVVAVSRQPSGEQWRAIEVLPPPTAESCTAGQGRSGLPRPTDTSFSFRIEDYRIDPVAH